MEAPADIVSIQNAEGRVLFAIHTDGTVSGDIEDASAAGEAFCKSIERYMSTWLPSADS